MTTVQICNMALGRLGIDLITALTDDTRQARACATHYEQTVEEVLAEFNWAFAKTTSELAQSEDDNHTDYTYIYQLPPDFNHMIEIVSVDTQDQDWQVVGDKLGCNLTTCTIRYVRNGVVAAKFPSWFIPPLYLRLASKIAFYLTQSMGAEQQMLQLYAMALPRAKQLDAIYGGPRGQHDDLWEDIN